MSKAIISILVTTFYLLTLFIIVIEFIPRQLNELIDTIFSPTRYNTTTGAEITLDQLNNDQVFRKIYGEINDSRQQKRFSDINIGHTYPVFSFKTSNGFTIDQNPEIRILSYYESPIKINLAVKNWFGWNKVDYEIADSNEIVLGWRDSLLNIRDGAEYYHYCKETYLYLNKLPVGKYKISFRLFSQDVATFFSVYDTIKTKWVIDPQQLIDSTRISLILIPQIDARFYYVGTYGSGMPVFNWRYFIYKDGSWSDEKWLRDYKMCGTGFDTFLSDGSGIIISQDINLFYVCMPNWFEFYLKDYKLNSPRFTIESFYGLSQEPYDDNFFESEDFKKYFKEEWGDSISLQFTFLIDPLTWSKYNYQEVFSPTITFNTDTIYNKLIKNLRKNVKSELNP